VVEDGIPYPGTVNQPGRQFKRHDQYDNWQEVVNHPLPDMRHDWQNDTRDEIGFGIPEPWGVAPTTASVKVAANKAVKLAYLLLGEKVEEEEIEKQATDFMLLGPEALDRSLSRFAKTQELYASDDEDEDDSKEASVKKADDDEDEDDSKEASVKKADDDEDEDDEESVTASEELAEKAAEDGAPVGDTGASEKAASKSGSRGMDIELSASMDDGETDIGADPRLAGLFDDGIPSDLPEPGTGRREASAKKGVKSLGGQPRVASNGEGVADISSIWNSAPDVSEVFR